MKNQPRQLFAILNIGLFAIAVASLGILFFIKKPVKMSDVEKRELAQLPHFSWKKLFKGEFTRDLDLYVSDQFPMREKFVECSFSWRITAVSPTRK